MHDGVLFVDEDPKIIAPFGCQLLFPLKIQNDATRVAFKVER